MHLKPFRLLIACIACFGLFPLDRNDVVTFSDKEEKKESLTRISAAVENDIITAVYAVPENTALGYAYAGVSVNLTPDENARSLVFTIRKDASAVQPNRITLRTKTGKRAKVDLPAYGSVTEEWKTFRISLDDFSLSRNDIASLASAGFSLAGNNTKDNIDSVSGTVWLRDIRLSTETAAAKQIVPDYAFLLNRKAPKPAKGHAGWIYRESEAHIERIKRYNKENAVPFRMLFVYAGSYTFTQNGGRLSPLKTGILQWFRERLPAETAVYATIDASDAKTLGSYPPAEQERLAKLIAQAVDDEPAAAGVHFDIEPYDITQLPFYIAAKKAMRKPVSAAFGAWDIHVLSVVDYPVLMAYDMAHTPDIYRATVEKACRSFAMDADAAKSCFYLGFPFVAAQAECEYRINRETGARESTAYTMEQYISAAVDACRVIPQICSGDLFGGVSVWAFPDENKKGIGPPAGRWGYYPNHLKESCLSLLSNF
ncbi:MAG: hypothetical protein HZC28_01880 [Spirochaetes bacterium]|nr:hypothetical protein [Spirochaetota bacterium]